jgi:glycosyltransferase involved in cell wall biosynthesis
MMKSKRVLVSVSNDLATDQRVARACTTLCEMGFEVRLLGRLMKNSPALPHAAYSSHRMRLLFHKGPLFYAELNLRLFFFLLWRKADILYANDLDTLLPNALVSIIKRIPLVYDSHEYFTGVPELQSRPLIRRIWKAVERFSLPKADKVITVNQSIAELYAQEYSLNFQVIRNLPAKIPERSEGLSLPVPLPDSPFILLQGNGINVDRGGEEAVMAMHTIRDVKLVILGAGDRIPALKEMVAKEGLHGKVIFIPRQSPAILHYYTEKALLGLSLDKPSGINQRLSLPNKLFDYIRSGVPVVATDLPEVTSVVETYGLGRIIPVLTAETLSKCVNEMLSDSTAMSSYRENCRIASQTLNWEHEKQIFIDIFEALNHTT